MKLKHYLKEEIELKIYFGHPRAFYKTKYESKSLMLIKKKWPNHVIINPGQPGRFDTSVAKSGFKVFFSMVARSQLGIFMSMKDGKWTMGTWREAVRTEQEGKEVWRVNPWKGTITKMSNVKSIKPLSNKETYMRIPKEIRSQYVEDEDAAATINKG